MVGSTIKLEMFLRQWKIKEYNIYILFKICFVISPRVIKVEKEDIVAQNET